MKSSFFFFVFLLVFLLAPFISKAQAGYEDAVYLKSGAIIYGTIIEDIPNDHVTIKTVGGNIFTNKWRQIYKVTKVLASSRKKEDTTFHIKEAGMPKFMNLIELNGGYAFGVNPGSVPYGVRAIFGCLINSNYSIGLGIGYDRCDSFSFVPMFVDFRNYTITQQGRIAVAFDVGGSPELSPTGYYYLGGVIFCVSINKYIPLSKRVDLTAGIGFSYQQHAYVEQQYNAVNTGLSCLKLSLGFSFD